MSKCVLGHNVFVPRLKSALYTVYFSYSRHYKLAYALSCRQQMIGDPAFNVLSELIYNNE